MSKLLTLLYYKYARIEDPELFREQHLRFCKDHRLVGRILIANEGINGTVSGNEEDCNAYMNELQSNPLFQGIEFKIDEVTELSFERIHVRVKPELVSLGEYNLDPNTSTVPHLNADQVVQMMEDPDAIFLDTRNKVEWEVGKFKNAITLNIDHFRDFPEAVNQLSELKDKKVVAYCTGGIRCEKATMVMQKLGFKNVFQIDGGIVKYAKTNGGYNWDGKMYVFDKRVAIDINSVNPSIIGKCFVCGNNEDRLVNCANPECNNHFVLCSDCGINMKGCCSVECMQNPKIRPYDGTGYYSKGPLPPGYK